jgi:ribose/xylose/arabinose/galactoside ABC-type transport system permease subunit
MPGSPLPVDGPSGEERATTGWRERLGRISFGTLPGVVLGLIAVCVYFWVSEPLFMTWSNWENIVRAESVVAILAIGMTYVLLTGGIDLSVASSTAVTSMSFALLLQDGVDWRLGMAICVLIGLGLGVVNGSLIGFAKIPFFVVTLGTLAIFQSIALLVTEGGAGVFLIGNAEFDSLSDAINGSVGPIPNLLIIVAVLYVVSSFVLSLSQYGRSVYALGSNREAARLIGIPVTVVLVSVYAMSGLTAGAAGVAQTALLAGATPIASTTLMLTVVTAVLIGGVALTGGQGNLLGTIVAVVFLGVIENGLTLSGVAEFWQGFVTGLILIAAVAVGVVREFGFGLQRLRSA